MPTRWIMLGLRGFAIASALALALAAAGPIDVIRLLGAFALALALVGTAWHAYLLRRYDPHAFNVLRYQMGAWITRMKVRWARARHAMARTAHGGITTGSP